VACWKEEASRYKSAGAGFVADNKLATESPDSHRLLRGLGLSLTPIPQRLADAARRFLEVLQRPHEWHLGQRVTGSRICGSCLLRAEVCGRVRPVFMPLRRPSGRGEPPSAVVLAPAADPLPTNYTGTERRGFEPVWACRACACVYMAEELEMCERRRASEPSVELEPEPNVLPQEKARPEPEPEPEPEPAPEPEP